MLTWRPPSFCHRGIPSSFLPFETIRVRDPSASLGNVKESVQRVAFRGDAERCLMDRKPGTGGLFSSSVDLSAILEGFFAVLRDSWSFRNVNVPLELKQWKLSHGEPL